MNPPLIQPLSQLMTHPCCSPPGSLPAQRIQASDGMECLRICRVARSSSTVVQYSMCLRHRAEPPSHQPQCPTGTEYILTILFLIPLLSIHTLSRSAILNQRYSIPFTSIPPHQQCSYKSPSINQQYSQYIPSVSNALNTYPQSISNTLPTIPLLNILSLPLIPRNVHQSLMLVTALNVHIGYENAAKIAKTGTFLSFLSLSLSLPLTYTPFPFS